MAHEPEEKTVQLLVSFYSGVPDSISHSLSHQQDGLTRGSHGRKASGDPGVILTPPDEWGVPSNRVISQPRFIQSEDRVTSIFRAMKIGI